MTPLTTTPDHPLAQLTIAELDHAADAAATEAAYRRWHDRRARRRLAMAGLRWLTPWPLAAIDPGGHR